MPFFKTNKMKKIPSELKQEVLEKAPGFFAAVLAAKTPTNHQSGNTGRLDKPVVRTRLTQFRGNFGLVYAAIWFANSHDVAVLFDLPNKKQ
jgi:hypothetical protein